MTKPVSAWAWTICGLGESRGRRKASGNGSMRPLPACVERCPMPAFKRAGETATPPRRNEARAGQVITGPRDRAGGRPERLRVVVVSPLAAARSARAPPSAGVTCVFAPPAARSVTARRRPLADRRVRSARSSAFAAAGTQQTPAVAVCATVGEPRAPGIAVLPSRRRRRGSSRAHGKPPRQSPAGSVTQCWSDVRAAAVRARSARTVAASAVSNCARIVANSAVDSTCKPR